MPNTITTISLLLGSAHFFSDEIIGTQIKSPVELMLQLIKGTGRQLTYTEEARVERLIRFLEQELLNPPGVDGWAGHHNWISTNSLPLRWVYSDYLLSGGSSISKATLLPMADELYDRYDPHAAFFLPAAIAEHFLAVSLDMVDIPEVDEEFAGDLNTFPIPAEVLAAPPYVRNLAKIFLGSMPWYEWDLSNTGSNDRVIEFVKHIVRYPEYQLM